MASISKLLQIIGLFCRIQSLLQGSFAKEIYNFKEPTNRSHPIVLGICACMCACAVSRVRACGEGNV